MDAHHLHLIVNHFPVFGTFFTAILLVIAIWQVNNVALRRVALGAIIFVALGTIPADVTGDGAMEALMNLDNVAELGISGRMAHEHEQAADKAFTMVLILGGLAAAGVFLTEKKKHLARPVMGVLLVLTLGMFAMFGYVSNLGGKIHRPELRGSTMTASSGGGGDSAHELEHDDH